MVYINITFYTVNNMTKVFYDKTIHKMVVVVKILSKATYNAFKANVLTAIYNEIEAIMTTNVGSQRLDLL